VPRTIQLPDHWGDARAIVGRLAQGGHRFTEYRVLDKAVVELECPCADLDELPQVCLAAE
jgi:hypothetical protein